MKVLFDGIKMPEVGVYSCELGVLDENTAVLTLCYGKCNRCVWKYNGGCSVWNGYEKYRYINNKISL